MAKWSPYLVGFLIGVLLIFLFIGRYQIGVSSGVARAALLVEESVLPAHSMNTPYLQKLLSDHIIFDWKILFIVGLFFGSMISSKISGSKSSNNSTVWENKFGKAKVKRYFVALIGGVFLLFGARLADGCTSGHAISGGAQMSVASWVFMMAVFATAIPVSLLLYRKK